MGCVVHHIQTSRGCDRYVTDVTFVGNRKQADCQLKEEALQESVKALLWIVKHGGVEPGTLCYTRFVVNAIDDTRKSADFSITDCECALRHGVQLAAGGL